MRPWLATRYGKSRRPSAESLGEAPLVAGRRGRADCADSPVSRCAVLDHFVEPGSLDSELLADVDDRKSAGTSCGEVLMRKFVSGCSTDSKDRGCLHQREELGFLVVGIGALVAHARERESSGRFRGISSRVSCAASGSLVVEQRDSFAGAEGRRAISNVSSARRRSRSFRSATCCKRSARSRSSCVMSPSNRCTATSVAVRSRCNELTRARASTSSSSSSLWRCSAAARASSPVAARTTVGGSSSPRRRARWAWTRSASLSHLRGRPPLPGTVTGPTVTERNDTYTQRVIVCEGLPDLAGVVLP